MELFHLHHRALRTKLLFIPLVACLCCSPTWADSIEILGVPFELERIEEVDSTSVKITIGGKTRIVKRAELEAVVVSETFSQERGAVPLEPRRLEQFVRGALQRERRVWAMAALNSYLGHTANTQERKLVFFQEISEMPGGHQFLKDFLVESREINEHPHLLSEMLFVLALEDAVWVRANALRHLYRQRATMIALFSRMYFDALKGLNLERSTRIVEVEGELFGFNASHYQRHRLIDSKIQEVVKAIERGHVVAIQPLIDMSEGEPDLALVLPGIISNSVHRSAESAIRQGDAALALRLLRAIRPQWRTPTTHSLVQQALQQLKPEHSRVLLESGVRTSLELLAEKDTEIRSYTLNALEQYMRLMINEGNPEGALRPLAQVRRLRPDPSPENDRLRVDIAIGYAGVNQHSLARGLLKENVTGLTLSDRVRIFWAGIYISPKGLFGILLLALGLGLVPPWFLRARRARQSRVVNQWREGMRYEDGHEFEDAPLFSSGVSSGLNPRMYEYVSALRKLGLGPGADLRTIKAAYRNAVKEAHPDRAENKDSHSSERFIEIKGLYERIVALRKEMGMPGE